MKKASNTPRPTMQEIQLRLVYFARVKKHVEEIKNLWFSKQPLIIRTEEEGYILRRAHNLCAHGVKGEARELAEKLVKMINEDERCFSKNKKSDLSLEQIVPTWET